MFVNTVTITSCPGLLTLVFVAC